MTISTVRRTNCSIFITLMRCRWAEQFDDESSAFCVIFAVELQITNFKLLGIKREINKSGFDSNYDQMSVWRSINSKLHDFVKFFRKWLKCACVHLRRVSISMSIGHRSSAWPITEKTAKKIILIIASMWLWNPWLEKLGNTPKEF